MCCSPTGTLIDFVGWLWLENHSCGFSPLCCSKNIKNDTEHYYIPRTTSNSTEEASTVVYVVAERVLPVCLCNSHSKRLNGFVAKSHKLDRVEPARVPVASRRFHRVQSTYSRQKCFFFHVSPAQRTEGELEHVEKYHNNTSYFTIFRLHRYSNNVGSSASRVRGK